MPLGVVPNSNSRISKIIWISRGKSCTQTKRQSSKETVSILSCKHRECAFPCSGFHLLVVTALLYGQSSLMTQTLTSNWSMVSIVVVHLTASCFVSSHPLPSHLLCLQVGTAYESDRKAGSTHIRRPVLTVGRTIPLARDPEVLGTEETVSACSSVALWFWWWMQCDQLTQASAGSWQTVTWNWSWNKPLLMGMERWFKV